MDKVKKCLCCGNELSLSHFGKSKDSSDGLQQYCVTCNVMKGRMNKFYAKQGGVKLCNSDESQLPIFLPKDSTLLSGKKENMPKEEDMIQILKGKGYKILKPTYTEV